ncbi:reverse transcriptase [Tanacetum coccineum]
MSAKDSCKADMDLQKLITNLEANPQSHKHYTWTNGQLRKKGKLVVGVQATIKRITGLCYSKKLRQQVKVFMEICKISMDFIVGLPSSYGKTTIFVVVDRLSKYAHFVPLSHPFTATHIAQVLYGQPPPNPIAYVQGQCLVDGVDRALAAREAMFQLLYFYLTRAQDIMKAITDAKRTNREFVVGQWVYLKLQPHRAGQVAYHLELPNTSQVHPVFHVSQLKKYKGPIPTATAILPQCHNDGELLSVPMEVLDRRFGKVGNVAQVYVLIRWSNGTVDDAT